MKITTRFVALALAAHVLLGHGSQSFASESLAGHDPAETQILLIDRALRTSSEPAPLYLRRAEIELSCGSFDIALATLDLAEAHGASARTLAMDRAACWIASGEAGKAVLALTVALELSPWDAELRVRRGRACAKAGQRFAAISDLRFARRLDADVTAIEDDFLLADLWSEWGSHRAARRSLDRAIEHRGENAALLFRVVEAHLACEEYEAALTRLDTLAGIGIALHDVCRRKGDVLALAGDLAAAVAQWTAALDELNRLPGGRRRAPAHRRTIQDLEQRIRDARSGMNR